MNYITLSKKQTALEIVNNMGIGYNLANTFDNYAPDIIINNPIEQITLKGNSIPTKQMIKNLKKTGFKTIRFPITWINFIDDIGNINTEWMSLVKRVVDMIIKNNMYCIINLYNDGNYWLSEELASKNKYINFWTQIANEFKDFNEYLVFESMRDIQYFTGADYMTVLILNQAFIDTVRNSGGKNGDRLLIVSGANRDISYTCSDDYKVPIDPSKKFAVSIYYYYPNNFCSESTYFI